MDFWNELLEGGLGFLYWCYNIGKYILPFVTSIISEGKTMTYHIVDPPIFKCLYQY